MDLVILGLLTEILKAFNAIYADQPVVERRAAGLIWWNATKWLVYPFLSADQRKQIDAILAPTP